MMIITDKNSVDHYEKDEVGRIVEVVGSHNHMGHISQALAERLLINGVESKEIHRFSGNELKN